MQVLNDLEVENFTRNLTTFKIKDFGTTIKWAEQHQKLRRLQMQQAAIIQNSPAGSSDFVKDTILSEPGKLKILLKELLSVEIWKRNLLPVLLKTGDFNPQTCLPIDMVLEHELVVLAILENCCFHTDTLVELDDLILDLVDYCHRALNTVVAVKSSILDDDDDNETCTNPFKNQFDLSQCKTSNKDKKDFDIKNVISDKVKMDSFKLAEKCLGILFDISNNFDSVPISTVTRLMNTHNLPILATQILTQEIFEKPSIQNNRESEIFYDSDWHPQQNKRLVYKLKGKILFLLYNLLMKEDIFSKYELSNTNISGILKLREIVSPNYVLEQFGILTAFKAQLDYLAVQGDNFVAQHNAQNNSGCLIMEVEPDLKEEMKSLNFSGSSTMTAVIADQMRFWIKALAPNTKSNFLPNFANEINKAFDMDKLIELVDKMDSGKQGHGGQMDTFSDIPSAPPSCLKCGDQAKNRCGRCQLVWYCSRECQGKDWKKHKKGCVKIEDQLRG